MKQRLYHIKRKEEDKKNNSLKELTALQNFGPFCTNYNKVSDEIEIIKSRTLIKNVVDDLNLNIQYFEQGRIKEQEIYLNPPIKVNFFVSDSVSREAHTDDCPCVRPWVW